MKRSTEIQAGLFLFIALLLGAGSIFILGKERQIFATQEEYFVTFTDVKGLNEGAPVRLGGITVGRVDKISFSENLLDPRVHVRLLINEDFLERIRKDTTVSIETQGLLGDRFLSLSLGVDKQQITPGNELPGMESADIGETLGKASEVVDSAVKISQEVEKFLTELRTESLENINSSVKSLSSILDEIENGNGTLHRLVYSEEDGDGLIENLEKTSKSLEEMVQDVKKGNGALHSLIYDPKGAELIENLSSASANISAAAETITKIGDEIVEGEGFAHKILFESDEGSLAELIKKLHKSADNVQRASEALARGQGTLGALLVDTSLYDHLVEVTDGAKRSTILRYAIKKSIEETREKSKD